MSKLNERTIVNMEFVLEEACRLFPNGGDHERRKYIAQILKRHAMQGDTTLTDLEGGRAERAQRDKAEDGVAPLL
jgi:hypothetical protein